VTTISSIELQPRDDSRPSAAKVVATPQIFLFSIRDGFPPFWEASPFSAVHAEHRCAEIAKARSVEWERASSHAHNGTCRCHSMKYVGRRRAEGSTCSPLAPPIYQLQTECTFAVDLYFRVGYANARESVVHPPWRMPGALNAILRLKLNKELGEQL